MARGIEGNEIAIPKPATFKKTPSASQSGKGQKSILGFFQKKTDGASSPVIKSSPPANAPFKSPVTVQTRKLSSLPRASSTTLTPVPTSDAPIPSSSPPYNESFGGKGTNKENGLQPSTTLLGAQADGALQVELAGGALLSSPLRKVNWLHPCSRCAR